MTLLTIALALVAALVVARSMRLSVVELATLLLPVAFYPPIGARVNISLADFLTPFLLIAALPKIGRQPGRHRDSLTSIAASYVGLLLIVMWTSAALVAIRNGSDVGSAVQGASKFMILPVYTFAFMAQALKSRHGLHRLLHVWQIAATTSAILAVAGVALYTVGIDAGISYAFRARGSFEDPNAFATYCLISAGIVMASTYARRDRVWSASLAVLFTAIILSGSRTAAVALALAGLATAVLAGNRREGWRLRVSLFVAAAIAALAIYTMPRSISDASAERILGVGQSLEAQNEQRLALWPLAVQMWDSNPILGVGIGQFKFRLALEGLSNQPLVAHNTYLSFLAETGVVGALALLWFPLAVAVALITLRSAGSLAGRALSFSFVAVGVMAATLNLQNHRPFWACLGIAVAVVRHYGAKSEGTPRAGHARSSLAVPVTPPGGTSSRTYLRSSKAAAP